MYNTATLLLLNRPLTIHVADRPVQMIEISSNASVRSMMHLNVENRKLHQNMITVSSYIANSHLGSLYH